MSRSAGELGWMVVRGRKVARPPSRCFKYCMARLPSVSFSTTIYCFVPPKAISMATAYSSGTEQSGHRAVDALQGLP